MVRTVHKWRLPVTDGPFPIALPVGSQLLHAEMAHGPSHDIEMWAEVETGMNAEQRWFIVRGTGHPVPDDAEHIASMRDGAFVWHLFEVSA